MTPIDTVRELIGKTIVSMNIPTPWRIIFTTNTREVIDLGECHRMAFKANFDDIINSPILDVVATLKGGFLTSIIQTDKGQFTIYRSYE